MSEESWKATVTVTVHGVWDPADEDACAALIAAVNALRSPENERPCIRRGWWSNDSDPWLDVKIGNTSMRLDAGNYLVSVLMPDGSTVWDPLHADEVAMLRPAHVGAAIAQHAHRKLHEEQPAIATSRPRSAQNGAADAQRDGADTERHNATQGAES